MPNDLLERLRQLETALQSLRSQKLLEGSLEQKLALLEQHSIVKCQYVDVTTHVTPDTEFSVNHGLGSVPTGYIVISRDKAATIYDSTTAWTIENIYLKSNVATVAIRLLIF